MDDGVRVSSAAHAAAGDDARAADRRIGQKYPSALSSSICSGVGAIASSPGSSISTRSDLKRSKRPFSSSATSEWRANRSSDSPGSFSRS